MSEVSVKTGDKISEGQSIGLSGATGNARGLPANEQHTHIQVKINGERVDPQKHFNENPSIKKTDK